MNKYNKCDRCNKVYFITAFIFFKNYNFCPRCVVIGVSELRLQIEEKQGLKFKYKKDRNNYLKKLKEEEKIKQEKRELEKDGRKCYFCKKKYIWWKMQIKIEDKDLFICKECTSKPKSAFLKKDIEYIAQKHKESFEDWMKEFLKEKKNDK